MKPRPFEYARPDTVDEALELLAEYGDDARFWPAASRSFRCLICG